MDDAVIIALLMLAFSVFKIGYDIGKDSCDTNHDQSTKK